ncbi:MAG TPA: ABC transporter ATP-binding protein [Thermoleophilaceae bacterium]|nr:ABC transporter ATP-binding protein [Thermoleophilaceae bacterium]
MRPGEIVLEEATRSFKVTHERSQTLKELAVSFGRRSRRPTEVHALRGVDLRVEPGEAVGMVGRNGAGKTSLLRCLAGIVPLDSGRADTGGRTVSLLELGAGFGQDFTGRENIWLNGALYGFDREEIEERIDRIVEFSELGEFIDVPVKAYSTGMFLRLGFAIVAHLDADVLLIDEILAVGDESFQRKCLARISEQMERGATLVLVSHDPAAIERVCDRVVVLDAGQKAFDGGVAEGLLHYHRMLGTESGGSQSLRPSAGGALTIAELEVKDDEGRVRHMFRPGEVLRADLVVAGPAERAVLALEVRGERGELLFRTDATIGAVEDTLEASFEIPRLALLGGDYDLSAGVGDQDPPFGGQLDRVARFSVAHVATGEGVADLRGTWTVAGRTEAVS